MMAFLEQGCGCDKGPNGEGCLKQFSISDIVEQRLNCMELDYMTDHENQLNIVIAAKLNALLHRDEKLMCSKHQF